MNIQKTLVVAKSPTLQNFIPDETPVEEVDFETKAMTDRIKGEFQIRYANLDKDIQHIDSRLQHIQQFCTNLESQIQQLQQLVKSDNNPGKKGNYYKIMNECMELNANYEALYIRCMELKQKYRKEQNDLQTKVSKFTEVEIPKSKVDQGDQTLTPASLAIMMQELTKAVEKNDSKAENLKHSIVELEQNEDYKL